MTYDVVPSLNSSGAISYQASVERSHPGHLELADGATEHVPEHLSQAGHQVRSFDLLSERESAMSEETRLLEKVADVQYRRDH